MTITTDGCTLHIKSNISNEETIFVIAHEIRHLWQFEQKEFMGYFDEHRENESDISSYNDQILEIDAHAFAYAFIKSHFGAELLFNGLSSKIKRKIKDRAELIISEEHSLFRD